MKLASNQTRKFENLEMREDPTSLSIIKIRGKCSTGAVSAFAPSEIWQCLEMIPKLLLIGPLIVEGQFLINKYLGPIRIMHPSCEDPAYAPEIITYNLFFTSNFLTLR